MQTQIKTKELTKIFNPFSDTFFYDEKEVSLNKELLESYVKKPKTNNVFVITDDFLDNLHKSIALYIINFKESEKLIELDIENKSNPITSGLFEYVANIYKKQEVINLKIKEVGDNLLLIKSKKLKEIAGQKEDAKNITLTNLTNFFSDIKKRDIEDKFFWIEDSPDLYLNIDFVIEKLKKSVLNKKFEENVMEFNKILGLCPKELLSSEDFKKKIYGNNGNTFNLCILEALKSKVLELDFNKDLYLNILLENQIKNNFDFTLLLFREYIKSNEYKKPLDDNRYNIKGLDKINWNMLFNENDFIKHILDKYHYSSRNEEISIVDCYPYLNIENKKRENVLKKYISCISYSPLGGGGGETYIDNNKLLNFPFELFEDEKFVGSIVTLLDFEQLNRGFKARNHENKLFKSKDFLLNYASKIENYKVGRLLIDVQNKENINKEYLMKLLTVRPSFYNWMISEPGVFSKYTTDLELIMNVVKHGLKIESVYKENLLGYFLEDGTEEEERFKITWLIKSRNEINGDYFFKNKSDIDNFNNKYRKVEYFFFKKENDSSNYDYYDYSEHKKILKEIKNKSDFFQLMSNIDKLKMNLNVNITGIYANLNNSLKQDKDVAIKLLSYGSISYQHLEESLQYNKEVILECVKRNENNLKNIPKEFFYDIDFSLEITKLMDKNIISSENLIPPFMKKFFENQEVNSGYFDYLTKYIAFNKLKTDLPITKENTEQTKVKNKI